jgi:hypothetical protein
LDTAKFSKYNFEVFVEKSSKVVFPGSSKIIIDYTEQNVVS